MKTTFPFLLVPGLLAALDFSSQASLIVYSSMDNATLGAGAGADNSATANFAVGNSVGSDGTAISDNSSGSVTSGSPGQIGESIRLSDAVGGNRRISYGNNFNAGTGSYTISLWINSRLPTSVTIPAQFILSDGNNSSSADGFSIWAENNVLYMRGDYAGSNNGSQRLSVAHPFGASEQNGWHHLALVIDNTAGLWTGYYDGLSSGATGTENGWSLGGGGGVTNTFAPGRDFSSTSELLLGIRNDLAAEWLGSVDDLAIWDEALSASQISGIYQNGLNGIAVPEPSLPLLAALALLGLVGRRRR